MLRANVKAGHPDRKKRSQSAPPTYRGSECGEHLFHWFVQYSGPNKKYQGKYIHQQENGQIVLLHGMGNGTVAWKTQREARVSIVHTFSCPHDFRIVRRRRAQRETNCVP